MANELKQLEELYLQAKEAYYSGESIMSDDEFDRLEEELRDQDSDVVNVVGYSDRTLKHPHLSPMCSLSKAQAALDGTPPIEQMKKWFSQFPGDIVWEATPKFDGNAVNLIYKAGKFSQAITRGDKTKGKDVTSKLYGKAPLLLKGETRDVEVRAEVVMPLAIFNKKYAATSKNARNYVAGILNRDVVDEATAEITFAPVEVRLHDGDYEFPSNTETWLQHNGFTSPHTIRFYAKDFVEVYDKMKRYRENTSPYQLDGFVIKAPEAMRKEIGETGHHPDWAIAIKFPPKETITTVTGFKWNVGTTGEITPIATLSPVDLDGTTIKNVAAFNFGYIEREKIYPGAKVVIAKAGDIIPQIYKVVAQGDEKKFNYPKTCPICGTPTQLDTIHLLCPNEECEGKMFRRFRGGVGTMKLEKFGTQTCKLLYDAGYTTIMDIFNPYKFNKQELIKTGYFKDGKTLDALLAEVDKVTMVPLFRVILALGFDGVGMTAAKQIARLIGGQTYNFSGLEKVAVEGFELGGAKRAKVEAFARILGYRKIEIEKEIEVKDGIGVEFTGSPSGSGFKTKAEFEKFLGQNGYYHCGLKEAKLLLTDSMVSSSSKMTAANKLGIPIKTYADLVKELTPSGGDTGSQKSHSLF